MIELIQACSPQMQLPVAQAIIKSESSFNQFAIGINNGKAIRQPRSYREAVATAKSLLANGANIDMGYSQINSSNLRWLGLSVEQVFDPCHNLKAMQTIYLRCYDKAGETGYGTRMQRAFSCYNTGNTTRGFSNGYVNKVTKNFNALVGGANIQYHQYPQQKKQQKPILVNNVKPISTVSTVNAVRETKETTLPQDKNMVENVREAEVAETQPPVKVHLTWDVFRDY